MMLKMGDRLILFMLGVVMCRQKPRLPFGCSQAEQFGGVAVHLACQLLDGERSRHGNKLRHGGYVEPAVVGFNKHSLSWSD